MNHRLDATQNMISELNSETGWYKHNELDKVADVVEEYCNYTEDGYENAKQMVRNNFSKVRTEPPLKYSEQEPEAGRPFYWSEGNSFRILYTWQN